MRGAPCFFLTNSGPCNQACDELPLSLDTGIVCCCSSYLPEQAQTLQAGRVMGSTAASPNAAPMVFQTSEIAPAYTIFCRQSH